MKKHKKFLAIALVAVLVLTVGLTTTAFASEPTGDDTSRGPIQTFISKVANILGLEEGQVGDAMTQARHEMCVEARDESMEQRLERAVASGYFSQEQADEILTWWNNHSEVLQGVGPGEFVQRLNNCHREQLRHRLYAVKRALPGWLTQVFDERPSGMIVGVSDGVITLTLEDGSEVIVEYTSNTNFVLQGVTAVEEGQAAVAWCWEDAEGNLTARVVHVKLL